MTRVLVLAGVLALAALSLLAPSEPGYDPWAWLLWGRELAGFRLDTVVGPAFKPPARRHASRAGALAAATAPGGRRSRARS